MNLEGGTLEENLEGGGTPARGHAGLLPSGARLPEAPRAAGLTCCHASPPTGPQFPSHTGGLWRLPKRGTVADPEVASLDARSRKQASDGRHSAAALSPSPSLARPVPQGAAEQTEPSLGIPSPLPPGFHAEPSATHRLEDAGDEAGKPPTEGTGAWAAGSYVFAHSTQNNLDSRTHPSRWQLTSRRLEAGGRAGGWPAEGLLEQKAPSPLDPGPRA